MRTGGRARGNPDSATTFVVFSAYFHVCGAFRSFSDFGDSASAPASRTGGEADAVRHQ